MWLTVMNPTGIHVDMGSIPSLGQWVRGSALPWAVVWVAGTAQIWRCCGYSADQQLELGFNAQPGNFHLLQVQP